MGKKIIWGVILVGLTAWIANSISTGRQERAAEQQRLEELSATIAGNVASMIERTGANDGWAAALANGNAGESGIVLTVNLERVWIVDTPILFVGAIKDIKSSGTNSYAVVVEESLWSPKEYYLGTVLRLRLNVAKDVMDRFLEKHPDLFGDYGLNNGVAVAARIVAIEQLELIDEDGYGLDIKIGVGSLVDIVYTHREQFH